MSLARGAQDPHKVVLPGDRSRPVLFLLGAKAWELPTHSERPNCPDLGEGQPPC